MQFSACLPAALEKDGHHDGDELVVPLLLEVVLAVEKLADAHVVCLRGGGRVSSAEGSGSRHLPKGRPAIKRQTDFLIRTYYITPDAKTARLHRVPHTQHEAIVQ